MESKSKMFGHALHPILIVFPLGLLVFSVIFDVKSWKNRGQNLEKSQDEAKIAHALIGAGVLSGLVAAIPGIIDWLAIPAGTRAKRIGAWHGGGNVVQLLLFAASWMARRDRGSVPPRKALLLSLAGLAVGNGAAWLGGELVHRLGVSVDEGANLDARNSLVSEA